MTKKIATKIRAGNDKDQVCQCGAPTPAKLNTTKLKATADTKENPNDYTKVDKHGTPLKMALLLASLLQSTIFAHTTCKNHELHR